MTFGKKLMVVFAVMALAVAAFALPAAAAGHEDNWSGAFSTVSPDDGADSGFVILNSRKGRSDWSVQVQASGLEAGTSYEVILFYGNDKPPAERLVSLGCFTAKKNGKGSLHVSNVELDSLDAASGNPAEDRVNVRLDNPNTDVCDGIGGSAVLTTYTAGVWVGTGLNPRNSNR